MRHRRLGAVLSAAVLAGAVAASPAGAAAAPGSGQDGAQAASAAEPASPATEVTGLSVEHRVDDPLGIDVPQPRLGWQMRSPRTGQHQTAYQVLVSTSRSSVKPGRATMWDSGKVTSDESVSVRYDGAALAPSTEYWWAVRVWDKDDRASRWSTPERFETSLMSTDGETNWDGARWISMEGKAPGSDAAPVLRKESELSGKKVDAVRLYVSALGTYDAYINGQRVGAENGGTSDYELMAPGWTNYERTVNYMSYDVTDLVDSRRSVTLGAVLGNGWYRGSPSQGARYTQGGPHARALKAKLLVRYHDGSTQSVVTEPGSGWQATDEGPNRFDDIYDGQTTDGRMDLGDWSANGYDASGWVGVVEDDFTERWPESELVAYPGETARVVPEWDLDPQSVTVYDDVAGEESSENGYGHIVVDESRSTDDPGRAAGMRVDLGSEATAIFDLGQNMVGVPSYTVSGPEGTEVQFRFAEMLNDDSGTGDPDDNTGADGPEGSIYLANLRSAEATSTYTLGGDGSETHQDSLSFYGFRYVEVKVLTPGASVSVEDVTGKVASSALRDTGSLETNDSQINQLISNIRWGQRGNYLWVPTDCPQRDERVGWTADTQIFANTALYNGDATAFLELWQEGMVQSQELYGDDGQQYPATSPGGRYDIPGGMSGWADAGVVVPWTVWQMSGDPTIVEDSWDSMNTFMDWIYDETGDTYEGPGTLFGDWLAFQPTASQLMSQVYYAYSATLMSQMAEATGRTAAVQKYDDLFENIKQSFMDTYLEEDADGEAIVRSSDGTVFAINAPTTPEDNSQTALLWVLKLGLYETEEQHDELLQALVDNIENTDEYKAEHPDSLRVDDPQNTLSVGFLGINVLAPVLSDEGRPDLAYKLLLQDEMPSWLYSVENGATTVWERWNSYSTEDGFGPASMNSYNHYAYGAIAEWMYERMAGISKDTDHPGFKHFVLQPTLDPSGTITTVEGSVESPYGPISSEWQVEGDTFSYQASVPANTTATLRISTDEVDGLMVGKQDLADADGVSFVGTEAGYAVYDLVSGEYDVEGTVVD